LIDRLLERAAASGEAPRLTLAELEVLQLLGRGKTNKEIATARSRSLDTIKRQVASIYQKLGVDSRTAAVAVARARGLL
jgi:DNA-binding NarL/FixJ family response regulator